MKNLLFILFCSSLQFTLSQENYSIKKLKIHNDNVYAIEFSPDGNYLLTGSADKSIKIVDINTFDVIRKIDAHYGEVKDIVYSKTGNRFYSAGDKVIKQWSNDGVKTHLYSGNVTYIWSISLSYDERYIASGSYENYARVWETNSAKMVNTLKAHEKNVLAVAYSPDGNYFASGSLDKTVKLWDVSSGELIHTFEGHIDNIYAVDFTYDGKHLLSSSKDKTIKVWNVPEKKFKITLTGHEKGVLSAKFSHNGHYIISGSIDNRIKLWNYKRGECIHTFEEHEGAVNDVIFSPKDDMIASASNDNTVIIWEVKPAIFVNYYYENEFIEELDNSGLWGPKLKSETKADYKIRHEKGEEFRQKLIDKYYQKYLTEYIKE